MEKEPQQQADFIDDDEHSTPEQLKINLIDQNTRLFRKLLSISLKTGLIRLLFFMVVIVFEEQFIIINKTQNLADSWNVIFFVIVCMMDFLGILNDVTMMKLLEKDEVTLLKVKKDLMDKVEVQTETKIGKYTSYLSIFDIIEKYKYQSIPTASISETVRFLHTIITFYIFGNLALNSKDMAEGQTFKIIFQWLYVLSIYFNIFELDFIFLEGSQGSFLQKKLHKVDHSSNEQSEQKMNKTVKERYIKNCRRPFEVFFIMSILLMLAIIIVFPQLSLLNFMMVICINSHIAELIHEKHLQNKLIDLDFSQLSYPYLHCYKIVHQLAASNKMIYSVIRVVARVTIMLTVMAYFRESDTPASKSIMFTFANILLVSGQLAKFNRLAFTRLYVLAPFEKAGLTDSECSICLLPCTQTHPIIQLPCFSEHIFHYNCMSKWFQQRKECPLCRFSLEMYEMQ